MDRLGRSIEVTQYQQQMVPSTRFVGFDGRVPNVSSESFVAPTASVIGNVTIGKTSRYVVVVCVYIYMYICQGFNG
jgi:hypothetical protein